MKTETYSLEKDIEETHWWFTGRRRLFARELLSLGLKRDCPTLDIGTSTGANLRLLRDQGFTNVKGIDPYDDAILACAEKGLGTVMKGDITALPVASGSVDLIMATDVIEHVDDDGLALREIERVLAPGGYVLLTVPAFQSLWGLQDEISLHKRRYRKSPLVDLVLASGLKPIRHYYFNFLLFGPIWVARQLIRLLPVKVKGENEVNSPLLNRILTAVFSLDVRIAPLLRPPFGVSIAILACKAGSDRNVAEPTSGK